MIAALGWTFLLSAAQLNSFVSSWAGQSAPFLNIPNIALCTILTGFGMAILGALQTGFGTLNKTFDAPLERSTSSRSKGVTQHPAQQRKIIERGWVKDRAYVQFMDGSVEVETMLGRRIFPSLQDAQEFLA
jgi:hypothetical protein